MAMALTILIMPIPRSPQGTVVESQCYLKLLLEPKWQSY